jgi:hypothetical protein
MLTRFGCGNAYNSDFSSTSPLSRKAPFLSLNKHRPSRSDSYNHLNLAGAHSHQFM